ncbi:2TM domain-containing protein [Flavobacterium crassostreae]|uniref:2TM domain-containing protein n=1 Tax=Flavobacterium crassostreae TaxID=1763534 RepID=A0A1B9E9W4_9FLAO|nr:2TM domain-containing protein [Flavobacterium crassostreae]OCB78722.1 hypothetical protein LPBF_01640 [Flavobacterium crassostreae]
MQNTTTNQQHWQQVQKQAQQIQIWYTKCRGYLLINTGLVVLNLWTSPDSLWFYWPMLGWGIGLFFQAKKAFNWPFFLGKNWEHKKIQRILDQQTQQRQWE